MATDKSKVELERESIKVDSTNNEPEKEVDAEKEEEVEADEEEKEKEKEEDNEDVDKEEDGEKDPEEKHELTAAEKEVEKLKNTIERLKKRVGKTVGEKEEIKKQLADAKIALEKKKEDGEEVLDEDTVNKRAEELANVKATERQFIADCNKLADAATKIDKDFPQKVKVVGEEISPIPSQMVGILTDLDNDNGGAVLAHLVENVDEYEDIIKLPLTKMTSKLLKLSDKLAEEAKPKPRPISKVPAPNETVNGNRSSPQVLTDKMPMDEWVRLRNQQAEERRKAKYR